MKRLSGQIRNGSGVLNTKDNDNGSSAQPYPMGSGPPRWQAGMTTRRLPARASHITWSVAALALACCGLAACGLAPQSGAGSSQPATVQGSSVPPTSDTTPTASPTSSAAAGSSVCLASSLKGSLGTAQGAAGTFYQDLVLTNTSATSCTLDGYPGVSFVTAQGGSQVGAPANRNPISPVTRVTLAPGGKANFLVALTDVGVFAASQCQPTTVNWLRIYPPGDFDSMYVQYPSRSTCALKTKVVMTVSAVRPGLTGTGA